MMSKNIKIIYKNFKGYKKKLMKGYNLDGDILKTIETSKVMK